MPSQEKKKQQKLNLQYQIYLDENQLKVCILNELQSQFPDITTGDIQLIWEALPAQMSARITVSRGQL